MCKRYDLRLYCIMATMCDKQNSQKDPFSKSFLRLPGESSGIKTGQLQNVALNF